LKKIYTIVFVCFVLGSSILSGCVTHTKEANNRTNGQTVYEDIQDSGQAQGIGIESQDIVAMTDKIMRDMLTNPHIAGRDVAPYIIIDDKYFSNESSSVLMNKRLITERLMVNLNRAAQGRILFIERGAIDMVEQERKLKETGKVTSGTMGTTYAPAGADFRLTGKILSLDGVIETSGMKSRYHSITFKMIDLETAIVMWSGIYEFKKSSIESGIYR